MAVGALRGRGKLARWLTAKDTCAYEDSKAISPLTGDGGEKYFEQCSKSFHHFVINFRICGAILLFTQYYTVSMEDGAI